MVGRFDDPLSARLSRAVRGAARATVTAALGLALALGTTVGSGSPARADEPIGGPRLTGATLVSDLPAGVPAPPSFPARCFLLADLDTGDVLLARCPHEQLLPASTIKTLTALAVVDQPGDRLITGRQEDADQEGTKVGMKPGGLYSADQLMLAMLMSSGNDAAWALASAGGLDRTIARMNEVAAQLGARDTVAKNPSGLDAPGQVTSAYDLALIGRAALENAKIAAYVTTKRFRFPGGPPAPGKARTGFDISSHNRLLWNYDGTLGVKNGYTVAAGQTLIAAVERGGRRYLLTFLKSTGASWRIPAAMFDWAFAYGGRARSVGTLVRPEGWSGTAQPAGTPTVAGTGETAAAAVVPTVSPSASQTAPAAQSGRESGSGAAPTVVSATQPNRPASGRADGAVGPLPLPVAAGDEGLPAPLLVVMVGVAGLAAVAAGLRARVLWRRRQRRLAA